MVDEENPLELLRDYTATDLKNMLAAAVAEQDSERALLAEALKQPRFPIPVPTQKMLGKHGYARYCNVDLIRWRIAFWDEVKYRLLNWYATKRNDEAPAKRPTNQGK